MRFVTWGEDDFNDLVSGGFVVDTPVNPETGGETHRWVSKLRGGSFARHNLHTDDGGQTIATRWYFERKEDAAKFRLVWG